MEYHGITQIRASAGSGKTYTLTSLCVELLAKSTMQGSDSYENVLYNGIPSYTWMDIVAMTFTNKAALQMKEECIGRLKKIALGKEENREMGAEKAQQIFTKILSHYDKLRFRTIDSFLLQLLRVSSIDLGLSRNCDIVLDEIQEEEIINGAYTLFIEEAQNNTAYQILLDKCWKFLLRDNNIAFGKRTIFQEKLFPIIKIMLANGYFLPENMQGTSFIEEYQDIVSSLYTHYSSATLKKKIDEQSKALYNYLEKHDAILSLDARAAKAFQGNAFTKKGEASVYIQKKSLLECYNKKAKPVSKEAEELYKEITYNTYLYTILSKSVEGAYRIAPLVEIAQYIIQNIYAYQKQHSLILFSTVPRVIENVFTKVSISETVCKMGSKIRHVLLDEFQDTSNGQWNAMHTLFYEILSSGGSLTYVGDTKQAIYGWRGGDSRLFEKVIDMFHTNVQKKTLEFNWRSAEPIVRFNNIFSLMENREYARGILSSLFTQEEYEYIAVEYPYLLEDAIVELTKTYTRGSQEVSEKTMDKKGSVYIVEVREQDIGEEDHKTIYNRRRDAELHARILTILGEYDPEDVAILTKTNQEAEEIALLLTQWNIPYITEGNVYIKDSKLIQDIISFLRVIEDPLNDIAFCSVLYAKMLFYSLLEEEKIYDWLLKKRTLSLYHAFKIDLEKEWEQYFSPFCALSSNYVHTYVQGIYKHFQLYESYPHEKAVLDSLLEVIYSAENSGVKSVIEFLEYWEQYKSTFILGESSVCAISICTIHKSKGLEYPVVIIPYTDGIKYRSNLLPTTIEALLPEKEYSLFTGIADIPILTKSEKPHEIYYQNLLSEAVEHINKMYVAYTRAKLELHIILYEKRGKNNTLFSSANVLRWMLKQEDLTLFSEYKKQDSYGETHIYEYSTKEKTVQHTVEPLQKQEEYYPYKTREIQDVKNISSWMPKITIHHKEGDKQNRITAVQRGEMLHKIMSLLYSPDNEQYEHSIKRVFAEYRVSVDSNKMLYEDIYTRVQWFLEQEDLAIYTKKSLVERDILYKEQSKIKRVRPDSIVEIANNEYIILEYKTGKKEAKHKEQIDHYMKLFRDIKNVKVSGVLVYFDEEEIVRIEL
ncbi:MAG: UvrD-helicase domain-containing protein [Desulfovibrionaceae bacterium]